MSELYAFCPHCGINPKLDEDGCCDHCGSDAFGSGLDDLAKLMRTRAAELAACGVKGGEDG